MAEFGVINEIGDMGLGFKPLNKEDNQIVNEAVNKEKENKPQIVNEDKEK